MPPRMRDGLKRLGALMLMLWAGAGAGAADWPMWRHDARRSAASPQELPGTLHLQWQWRLPPQPRAWQEPINQDRMRYDECYRPIVMDGRVFFGSAADDSFRALDAATGRERWRLRLDGPVRLPPAGRKGKVYVACDDGYLYSVDAATGKVVWRFRGGPQDRWVLGNGRLINLWPARGGPVVADGEVYFGAGIWPFLGVFLHALDAETGRVVWTRSGHAPRFMMQIRRGPAFDGVAPQGCLAAVGARLLVPCGRSVPACFDRASGRFLYFHPEGYAGAGRLVFNPGKRRFELEFPDGERRHFYRFPYHRLRYVGGSDVCGRGDFFFNGGMAFDLATGGDLLGVPRMLVLAPETVYAFAKGTLRAYDLTSLRPKTGSDLEAIRGKRTKLPEWVMDPRWEMPFEGVTAMIRAGSRLVVGRRGKVVALNLAGDRKPPTVAWRVAVEGTPADLIAAEDRLFVITREGSIYAFGAAPVAAPAVYSESRREKPAPVGSQVARTARRILETTGVREGYCLAFGLRDGALIRSLIAQSRLRIIAFDPDARKVASLRLAPEKDGLYGSRAAVHRGAPRSLRLPPYLAGLVVSEAPQAAGVTDPTAFAESVFHVLRLYGGSACLALPERHTAGLRAAARRLPGALVTQRQGFTLLRRVGPLPGSADWTHPYGDAARSNFSDDRLAKPPLLGGLEIVKEK